VWSLKRELPLKTFNLAETIKLADYAFNDYFQKYKSDLQNFGQIFLKQSSKDKNLPKKHCGSRKIEGSGLVAYSSSLFLLIEKGYSRFVEKNDSGRRKSFRPYILDQDHWPSRSSHVRLSV